MDAYLTITFALLGWVVGLNVILYVEKLRDYKGIGEYSTPKLISLLLAWPVAYPVLFLSGDGAFLSD